VRLANLHGRATIVVADGSTLHAVDVERASRGALGPDPMVLSDLSVHPHLRELAGVADPTAWPVLDEAGLRAPVPRPSKGFGVALNYRAHAIESGRELPAEPALFGKTPNCVTGPFDDIVLPPGRHRVDYEAELVIVFGRTSKAVRASEAWSHLAGVTCGQDISDREEQFRPPVRQFTIAKSYDSFGPIGPWLVTTDELDDPDALWLEGRLDGEVVQSTSTDDLIFSVPALVEWLSRFITFEPGDLVWTGTPSGVGEAREPQRFLRDGMVLETEIRGVGTMRNRVRVGR
jgi:2-keto-4-pentenoate hydratase/2-oxohepta-3-ene-1,7-dioic acid hydratase in catechol pathway